MRVFYDTDTQKDFMDKDGALYVPCAELIKPNLSRLTKHAKANFIPIIGNVDNHFGTENYRGRELELKRWNGPFEDHCMFGTLGASKIPETSCYPSESKELEQPLFYRRPGVYIENRLDGKIDLMQLKRALKTIKGVNKKLIEPEGIYFEKQSYDVFTNPNLEEFLAYAEVTEAVIYGVATDYCVKAVVIGMQKRGIQCYVVEDAIKGISEETSNLALEEMANKRAKFVTTKQILEVE